MTTRSVSDTSPEPVIKAWDPRINLYWVGPAGAGKMPGPGTGFHAIADG